MGRSSRRDGWGVEAQSRDRNPSLGKLLKAFWTDHRIMQAPSFPKPGYEQLLWLCEHSWRNLHWQKHHWKRGLIRRRYEENKYVEDPWRNICFYVQWLAISRAARGRPQEMGWPLLPNMSQEMERCEKGVCRNTLRSVLSCEKLAKPSSRVSYPTTYQCASGCGLVKKIILTRKQLPKHKGKILFSKFKKRKPR